LTAPAVTQYWRTMRITRVVLAFVVIAIAGGRALAAEALPLGDGTACVLMPEAEAKAKLGVKKRHVLACADTTGKIVRVVITRKGAVECSDSVQVAGDGSTANGQPCRAVSSAHAATVPPLVNLTGSWVTDVDSLIGPVQCLSQVGQNGKTIDIFASCDVLGQPGNFTGSGDIAFAGYTFLAQGSADIPVYGSCFNGGMTATVTPDGQSMTGMLRCGSLEVPFRAHRR
jgi:hypothetical protein